MWITYSKADGLPWTVEIAYLSHHRPKGEDHFEGTVWRVYDRSRPCNWERRWTFSGWQIGGKYAGVYRSNRDPAGASGVIEVAQNHPSIKGFYTVTNDENATPHPHSSRIKEGEEIEWLKWPATLTPAMQNVVSCIQSHGAATCYPWHVRRKLGLESLRYMHLLGSMTYAGAWIDNRLTNEMLANQESAGRLRRPRLPHKRLTREDIVGYNDEPRDEENETAA